MCAVKGIVTEVNITLKKLSRLVQQTPDCQTCIQGLSGLHLGCLDSSFCSFRQFFQTKIDEPSSH
jgi:hypothetical protein